MIKSVTRTRSSSRKPKTSTELELSLHGQAIKEHIFKMENKLDQTEFLGKHGITSDYRAKMVDWMVEVLSTFKCSDQTFFLAIDIMDRFFKNSSRPLTSSDLHITGVAAMFIASKYEDVVPLMMKTMVNKIGHGKFSQDLIESRELEVLKAL